jgi:hypothetical protein
VLISPAVVQDLRYPDGNRPLTGRLRRRAVERGGVSLELVLDLAERVPRGGRVVAVPLHHAEKLREELTLARMDRATPANSMNST